MAAPDELLDQAACGLMQTSADGTFLRANRVFCGWLGYRREELVGRRRFQELLTMGGRIFHQTHWTPLIQMQGSVSEVKLELLHADGTKIPMVLNALRHEVGGVVVHELAAFVAHDRDQYEKELVRSRRRLEELVTEAKRLQEMAKDRALFAEQMVGIVSHDLRNPLSAIQMGVALLRKGNLTAGDARVLTRIARAGERANGLIADLLDFTQARIGKGLAVSIAPVDLHEVVDEAIEELALAYTDRTLLHERAGEGPCRADAARLAQLIGNLVSNAMAHGDRTRPVTVRSRIEPASFSVSVHNLGAPIPPEVQQDIFQPMVRGAGGSGSVRSVGLGLFIVSEIAKAHGGAAFVTSTAEGTTFGLEVPR